MSHYWIVTGGIGHVSKKRHTDEEYLKILRQMELDLAGWADVPKASQSAGSSDTTYYTRRKKFGGMAWSQLSEPKALDQENQPIKQNVADLELLTHILKESRDFINSKI